MGANPSRPVVYPMPVPVMYDTMPRKSRRRAYSTAYAYRQPAYGQPIYPQVTAHYPQPAPQYAPLQMAVYTQPQQPMQTVHPVQPVMAMPQVYVPVTTAPQVAAAQMPMPAPGPAVVPVAATVPHTQATGQMRMPEPIRVQASQNNAPAMPHMPPQSDRVVPPPPIIADGDPRTPSGRQRFTNFYRPADGGASMPQPELDPGMPFRPPTAPPLTDPTWRNPLPAPPVDVWESSPNRPLLDSLSRDVSQVLGVDNAHRVVPEPPEPPPSHHHSVFGGLFGSRKGKSRSRGGLFRSHSTTGAGVEMPMPEPGPSNRRHHTSRVPNVTNIVIPPPPIPERERPPPIKFNHIGEHGGFVNHSNHRIIYKNKPYPTALHLLEAMKFVDKPEIAEMIRLALDANEVYRLSSQYHEHIRPDWGRVFLKVLDDVLYLKFRQHPTIRHSLLDTGIADLVYADPNDYWGEGSSGEGQNHLGKAIRIR
ncbi:hypothetical protein EDD17DRAFT_1572214 [Pisolithus thermaeus]|nr:hypothetical protein EDD17DRAFT_1572214 [Pisolithus thermaeus]